MQGDRPGGGGLALSPPLSRKPAVRKQVNFTINSELTLIACRFPCSNEVTGKGGGRLEQRPL